MRSKAVAAAVAVSHQLIRGKHRDSRQHQPLTGDHRTAAVVNTDTRSGSCTGMPTPCPHGFHVKPFQVSCFCFWLDSKNLCVPCLLSAQGTLLEVSNEPLLNNKLNMMQKGCRALLPEMERRLQAKAQWLADVCEHQGSELLSYTMPHAAMFCCPRAALHISTTAKYAVVQSPCPNSHRPKHSIPQTLHIVILCPQCVDAAGMDVLQLFEPGQSHGSM